MLSASQALLLKADSRVCNMWSCWQMADRQAWMESSTNESIKKRSILNNKKLILPEHSAKGFESTDCSLGLLEVKNIVQTFSFQCSLYAHEGWLHSRWSTQQIPSHFPHRFPPANALQSHLPEKSKLKAQHMMLEFRWRHRRKSGEFSVTARFSAWKSKLGKV